jgi:hypothetical protein
MCSASRAAANAQTAVVVVTIGCLSVFAILTLANLHPHLLAPSGYPPVKDIISIRAWPLRSSPFLGFGPHVRRRGAAQSSSPIAPGHVLRAGDRKGDLRGRLARSLRDTQCGVAEVIESGGTALAVAAQPVSGRAGYWLMTVTALFATSGATNAGLFPAGALMRAVWSLQYRTVMVFPASS